MSELAGLSGRSILGSPFKETSLLLPFLPSIVYFHIPRTPQ